MKKIQNQLIKLRERLNITQKEMAQKLGIGKRTYERFETEGYEFSKIQVLGLQKFLSSFDEEEKGPEVSQKILPSSDSKFLSNYYRGKKITKLDQKFLKVLSEKKKIDKSLSELENLWFTENTRVSRIISFLEKTREQIESFAYKCEDLEYDCGGLDEKYFEFDRKFETKKLWAIILDQEAIKYKGSEIFNKSEIHKLKKRCKAPFNNIKITSKDAKKKIFKNSKRKYAHQLYLDHKVLCEFICSELFIAYATTKGENTVRFFSEKLLEKNGEDLVTREMVKVLINHIFFNNSK